MQCQHNWWNHADDAMPFFVKPHLEAEQQKGCDAAENLVALSMVLMKLSRLAVDFAKILQCKTPTNKTQNTEKVYFS